MSALIPMTKLPDNCAIGGRDGLGCPCFCHWNEYCQLLGETNHTAYFSDEKRPERCPLQFVPPHGRLIDVAVLWVEITKICDRRDAGIISDLTCLQQLLSAVRHAPTIIQAEEVEA